MLPLRATIRAVPSADLRTILGRLSISEFFINNNYSVAVDIDASASSIRIGNARSAYDIASYACGVYRWPIRAAHRKTKTGLCGALI
jgi:predicted RNA methylase